MNEPFLKNTVYDTIIRMAFLGLIIVWCLLIIHPFVSVMLWSFILAVALLPLHRSISKKIGNRPKLTSFLLVSLILLLVIVPLVLLVMSLVDEVREIKATYFAESFTIPLPSEDIKSIPVIGNKLYEFLLSASQDQETFIEAHQDQIIAFGKGIATGVFTAMGGIIQLILSLCIAGVLLVREDAGTALRTFFRKIAGERGDEFADLTVKTVGSVLKGVLGESFVLALMNAIVFALAGVPYPGFISLLVFIFAVVQLPVLLATVPVMIYFFVTKETMPAVLWSVTLLLISLSDNILTPLMLGKGAPVPMLVIFIGVIGGFVLSGFVGLFTGAIVLSVGYKLFTGWMKPEEGIVQG